MTEKFYAIVVDGMVEASSEDKDEAEYVASFFPNSIIKEGIIVRGFDFKVKSSP